MDLSSLSETQQQQLQQLHQQFQQHQQEQHQQQQQELASQAYDPSQAQPQPHAYNQSTQAYDPAQAQSHAYNQSTHAYDHSTQPYDQSTQAYDQSTQAYYPYHQYPQHHQQQHYPYYQHDYANAYQTQSQPSQTDVQPPGISVQYEAASSQALATATSGQGQYQQQQQNAYYPQGVAEQQQNSSSSLAAATPGQGQGQYHHHHQQQQHEHHNDYYPQGIAEQQQNSSSSYPVPSGLNPAAAAAVAALSQLNQFAGNMDAAERAMAGLQERQWQGKSGGYGPMPSHMYPQGGFHHEPHPVRGGAGRGGGQYRGGGRRGGGQFKGGRGNFGNRQSRADGSSPHFRGKGRGRGRGRRIPPHEVSSSPYPGATPMDELDSAIAQEEAEQSAVEQGEAPQTAPVPISATTAGKAPRSTQAAGRTVSSRRPPQIAWCELCRVDCTSLDILEQHNNGKRHKKNLQRFEELQQARNPVPVVAPTPTPIPAPVSVASNEPIPASAPESVPSGPSPVPSTTPVVDEKNEPIIMPECESDVPKQPENVQGDEIIKALVPENITTEAATNEDKMETEQQKDVLEQPDVAEAEPTEAQTRKRRMDGFDARRRGVNKMMMRGGRGSKRMRMTERPTRSVEPPKEVVPIICDLCNVKCDTQAVFDCHLSGKKHISKLKRFQSHQAIYGPVGLQALYPPNPNTQPIIIPQLHHQQPRYMPQTPFYPNSMRAYGPPQGYHVTHVAAGSETQARFNSVAHAPEINTGGSQVTVSMGLEGHQLAASVMQEHQQELAARIKSDNGITESVGKAFDVPLQKSVLQSSGNAVVGSEHVVVQSHTTNYAVQAPTYGVSSSENVILPGQSSKAEEPRE